MYNTNNFNVMILAVNIITCAKCETKYRTKAEDLKKKKFLKCSKCENKWPIEKDQIANPEEEIAQKQKIEEHIAKKKKCSIIEWIMCIFLITAMLIASCIVFYGRISHAFPAIYEKFRIYNTEDLHLSISLAMRDTSQGESYIIKNKISNNSHAQKVMPTIRINLLSDEKKILQTLKIPSNGTLIAPQESTILERKISLEENSNVEFLSIEIGNAIELLTRTQRDF